jgi:hypothetical protein
LIFFSDSECSRLQGFFCVVGSVPAVNLLLIFCSAI